MRKTIIIENGRIDILRDGYNIIEKSIHGEQVPQILIQALTYARDQLDMDNMDAIGVLGDFIEVLEESLEGDNGHSN